MNVPPRSSRLGRRLPVLVAAVLTCLSSWSGPAWAQSDEDEPPVLELRAIGNDEILWLIVGRWDPEKLRRVQGFSYLDKVAAKVEPARRIVPQVGRIRRAALQGDALHVFFINDSAEAATPGAHYRYTSSGFRRQRRLPGQVVPEALAGESGGTSPGLWALVEAKTANAVEAEWRNELGLRAAEDKEPEDEADTAAPSDDKGTGQLSPSAARAEGTYHLIRYDGANWHPGFAAPGACGRGTRFWLCVHAGRHCLLWQEGADDREIHYARRESDTWIAGPPVQLSGRLHSAFVGVINSQLDFTVLLADAGDSDRLRCASWVWLTGADGVTPGKWEPLPTPEDEQGAAFELPAGSAVGAFGDQLAFLRPGEESAAEVALWPTEGGPVEQFRKLRFPEGDGRSGTRQKLTDIISLMVLGAVVFMVFWRRQDSLAYAVALPEELQIVSPGRRAAAAALDILPAAVVVAWQWKKPISIAIELIRAGQASPEHFRFSDLPGELFWAWIAFRLIYAGYCTLFELMSATTPGKRLMGCMVLSESLAPPTSGQILIRNVMRIVELERRLQIWPFLLVVFVTRNRQRIGDLLARTIVVTQIAPFADDSDNDDQQDQSEGEDQSSDDDEPE